MKALIIFLLFLFINSLIFGQTKLFDTERELTQLFDSIYEMEDTPERELLNNQIIGKFEEALSITEAIHFQWNALDMIGKVHSEDGKLNIYTWHLQLKNSEYLYYGLLQYNIGKSREGKEDIVVQKLMDRSDQLKNPATLKLTDENWFGALYYGIKSYSYKRNTFYLLFAYDFHDNYSQKKIIEVLNINKKGDILFSGKFNMDFQEFNRIIFEYSDNVSMSLKYDERLDMIIYDHLSPFKSIFTGSYRFYSPDGSYDGLKFNKAVFQLQKDVDARNQ